MSAEPHVTESLPAYALGCLEPAEARAVEKHLSACAECRADLLAYRETAGMLAYAAPPAEPPASLRGRILASSAPHPARGVGWLDGLRAWLGQSSRLAWSAALVLLVALVVSNALLWGQARRTRTPEFRTIAMAAAPAAPQASGVMVIGHEGEQGAVIVDGLARLPDGQQYQVWLIQDGQRTSGGVFSVNPAGYGVLLIEAPLPLADYDSFGITIEPAGGSPAPTGKKVLGGEL